MKPSVGRQVHYVARGSADGRFPSVCRSATVTEVSATEEHLTGLCVVNPTGLFFHSLADGGVMHHESETPQGGTWHWPERVD